MIKHIFIIIIGMAIAFTACKSKTKTTQTGSEPACKVMVNFGSPGKGIDYAKYEKLTGMLRDKKLQYSEKVKGREGEKEICIPLTELKGKEKTDLVEQLKTFEDKSTYVSVSVN